MRRNTGSMVVRRAIIAAMIGMLTLSSPMTALAQEAAPVATEGTAESQSGSGDTAGGTSGGTSGSTTSGEGQESAGSNQSGEGSGENTASTLSAPVAAVAAQSVPAGTVPAYTDAAAESAVTDASNAADSAAAAAAGASSAVAALPDSVDTTAEANSAASAASAYNTGVTKAGAAMSDAGSAAVDAASEAVSAAGVASSAAKVCTNAAGVAASELAAALAVDSTSPTQEVKDAVAQVQKAAADADAAYDTAKTAYDTANDDLIRAIAGYNMVAALYGKTEISTAALDQTAYAKAMDIVKLAYTGATDVTAATALLDQQKQSNTDTQALMGDVEKVQNADLAAQGQAVSDAQTAYTAARTALSTAESTAQAAGNAQQAYYDALKTKADAAGNRVTAAQTEYTNASTELQSLQNILKNVKLDTVDYQTVADEIAKAQKAVADAKAKLNQARIIKEKTDNYAAWAASLLDVDDTDSTKMKATTGTFAQLTEDGDPAYVNGRNFDESDKSVISRNVKYFTSVKGSAATEIPYSLYRSYVQAMYSKYQYSKIQDGSSYASGKGTALDTGSEIVYWVVDSNNKLTGTYYVQGQDTVPADTTFFVGYTLKHESDGYHIDGVLYHSPAVTPGPTPNPTPNPTPATTASVASATVEDVATPLAATPQVLGVSRPAPAVTTPAVQEQPQVLGATRSRATGDETHDGLRMIIALAGASAAGILALGAKRRKKQDRKEQ